MSPFLKLYSASCSGVLKGEAREEGFEIIFLALNPEDAINSTARFLKDRCQVFNLIPGCIKVGEYHAEQIGILGEYRSGHSFPFFEWKYDTSLIGLEQILVMD